MTSLTSLEICAGAGGQALGLERAGFGHVAAVEIEAIACETLRLNRPTWNVLNTDARNISGRDYRGVDLFAGGVPCPPFSVAGKQLGEDDNRDLFPVALRIIQDARPTAVLLENVPGLATARFAPYRDTIRGTLEKLGYEVFWQTLNASQFGVPQLRPRFVLVGLKGKAAKRFRWPEPLSLQRTVGESLLDLMADRGWAGAERWALLANGIGPTLVGGSKLHGGPDLGPTRAKAAWRLLSVNGGGLADFAPDESVDVDHIPKLTVRMAARIQGFPDEWKLAGRKTAAYRQVGNAFPPPVAAAVGAAIRRAIEGVRSSDDSPAEISKRSA
jgi:DNA (cytosine-5)-methyltransferase 1